MVFGILMLIVIVTAYVLLVEGFLWKIILFFAGWFGLYIFLMAFVDGSNQTVMIVMGEPVSWAVLIPTVVCIMAMVTTKVRQ